jgi:hypothetical protein
MKGIIGGRIGSSMAGIIEGIIGIRMEVEKEVE